jgi:GNAT superfamily N-acetyltransferase
MWSANCAHYGAAISPEEDLQLWRRIIDPGNPVGGLVCGAAVGEGPLLGFANYVLHPHTFSSRLVCHLEDLWVDPSARGAGWGRKFIKALVACGLDRGWRRIYWHTETDNAPARRLYDRVSQLTNYVRYDVALP